MVNLNTNLVRQALNTKLSVRIDHFEVVWESCDWSETVKIIDQQGTTYFLKGTPRSRPEARVTEMLNSYNSLIVPKVLISDLLPDHEWCWFLMRDAGTTDYDHITPDIALQTAYHLGHLQSQVIYNTYLPKVLPNSLPADYFTIIQQLGIWLETHFRDTSQSLIDMIRGKLLTRQRFFEVITQYLSVLRPTCVHGDLWSGNIASSSDHVCLLDWGDAIWGIGTSSIVNLLTTSDTPLPSDDIWKAYADGWGQTINADLIQASELAYLLNLIVIEQQLTQFQPHQTIVPLGIQPIIETLIDLSG